MALICPTAQAKYFSRQDWTTQISLNRLMKFAFWRMRFCLLEGARAPRAGAIVDWNALQYLRPRPGDMILIHLRSKFVAAILRAGHCEHATSKASRTPADRRSTRPGVPRRPGLVTYPPPHGAGNGAKLVQPRVAVIIEFRPASYPYDYGAEAALAFGAD